MVTRKYLFGFLIAFTVIILSSCTTGKVVNMMQETGADYKISRYEDYQLQVNDEIYCIILTSNTDFSKQFSGVLASSSGGGSRNTSYTIYENGKISIPLFGEIEVAGLTIPQAENKIQEVMKREAIADAQVVVELKNKTFYIVSNGNKNGQYRVYKDNMTIFQALAESGEVDDVIDFKKVIILRLGEDGRTIEKTFDLRSTSIIESEFYYIKPNDVIYYSTSSARSFFRISSLGTFFATVITPLAFLTWAAAYKF